VDPGGRLAVLGAKGTQVRFFDAVGAPLGDFAVAAAGMQRVTDLALGPDGSLQLIDEGSGMRWVGQ
jgi:hypothetical protein